MSDTAPMTSFGPVPQGWLWGVATASHQIEGGNVGNDWWRWEHTAGSPAKESSGDACDSWNRWLEDLQLVQRMGLDSYRFSLEWSRIEPAEGEFSLAALEHYRLMLAAAQEMGLRTSVTFHHFTLPAWVADLGGWTEPRVVDLFARYCDIANQHLGDHIDVAATLNEPNVQAVMGYLVGEFPPGRQGDLAAFRRASENLVAAHRAARTVLEEGPGTFPVGFTLALADVVVHDDGDIRGEGRRLTEPPADTPDHEVGFLMSTLWLDAAREDDYLGVQTYFTQHVGPRYEPLEVPADWRTTQMGWTFTPEALGHTVRTAYAAAEVPLMVTENGVATQDDAERIEYYSRSLSALRDAMDDGVEVRGFFAWSLLDNFEWAEGYRPKFGLTEVDPVTFVRTPKPSSEWYAALVADSRR